MLTVARGRRRPLAPDLVRRGKITNVSFPQHFFPSPLRRREEAGEEPGEVDPVGRETILHRSEGESSQQSASTVAFGANTLSLPLGLQLFASRSPGVTFFGLARRADPCAAPPAPLSIRMSAPTSIRLPK